MKKIALAAVAAVALTGAATSASAAVTWSESIENDLFGTTLAAHGQDMLWDFDGTMLTTLVDYSGNVLQGPQGTSTTASPPFNGDPLGDTTKYASVQGSTSGTFSAQPGYYITGFSFYMGSPDTFNKLTFTSANGGTTTFTGDEIWGGSPDGNGDRTKGYRVYYDFGSAKVTSITFESGSNAFEFDGLAGTLTAVPEPGTWALMIMGFGGAGAMIRRRKAALA